MSAPSVTVRSFRALPAHRLELTFSDGTSGIADLSETIMRPRFTPLQDPKMFEAATLENGTLEWPCDIGIAREALYALAHGLPRPTTLEEVRRNELEMSLRELRRLAGKTQANAAADAGVSQSAISQLEGDTDHRISTLRRYLEAIGAELEVVAVLGDKRILLRGA